MNILEAMRVRRSVRTYTDQPVSTELLDRLVALFDSSDRLDDLPLRLPLMPGAQVEHAMMGLVGSYGKIVNPPWYAIGISRRGNNDQINFGFAMEQFVLACTQEGLGTCWIGGFFNQSQLDQAVPKDDDERIVCVCPVGYAQKRRMAERTMRALGGLNVRKPLAQRVYYSTWGKPAAGYLAEHPKMLEVFELARWAPSASNKQPVHCVFDADRIVLTVRRSLRGKYPAFVMQGRPKDVNFQFVDAGIAMAHIHLAAREQGLPGNWSLSFDESVLRQQYEIIDDARILGVFAFA